MLRSGFFAILPSRGWVPQSASDGLVVLRSPRDLGVVRCSAVRGDGAPWSAAKLASRVRARASGETAFDERAWSSADLRLASCSSVLMPALSAVSNDEPKPALESWVSRRCWAIARADLLVDVEYTSPDPPDILVGPDGMEYERRRVDVAADMVDCEEMVRTIRIDATA